MSKWTPGPWHCGHHVDPSIKCNCRFVCSEVYMGSVCRISEWNKIERVSEGGNDCPPEKEAIANAYLIAAAPELYEALDRLRIWALDNHEVPTDIVAHVEYALAKARGEDA